MDGRMSENERPAVKDDDIIAEAKERFEKCEKAESDNRARYKEAIKFLSGDQWDPRLKLSRERAMRPCLTMDRLSTHVNQVVNEQRQNKPAIKVHPVDNTGDVKVAEVFDGVTRHIERVSNADTAYETAGFTQVAAGLGYWRVLTEYCDDTAFEQDVVIRRITNALAVYVDPNAKEMDASDAQYMFVVEEMSRKAFEDEYGKDAVSNWAGGGDQRGWYSDDSVRVAEYFRVEHNKKTLCLLDDGRIVTEEELKTLGGAAQVLSKRKSKVREVQWFKLGGDTVIDSRVWPGKWIPIVRVVGNELDVDGKLQYSGLVHRAMDAQRAYNYWVSATTETVALQPKAPFIGVKGQFTGMEQRWNAANIANPAYLEVNPVDINGNAAPMPQRQSPPTVPTGAVQLTQMMAEDMQWITGQHAASFGARSNEQSGRAILARAQEGDRATYHYIDNLARGIRHTGRILVDLIPKVYDTPRVLRILGEDGSSEYAKLDPQQPQPVVETQDQYGKIERIYNLGVGRYDVEVAVGPSFGTKRMEAVDAMTALIQASPPLMDKIGDLYIRNQDWPGAQEMADRIARTIPPEIRGDEEMSNPEGMVERLKGAMQQAQQMLDQREQEVQQAQQLLQQADERIAELQAAIRDSQVDAQAKVMEAETKAEAEKYKADREVEIAAIQASSGEAQQRVDQQATEIAELRNMVESIAVYLQALQQPQLSDGLQN